MGYDVDKFVGEVHDSFICGVCLDVLEDPVMIKECEHIFCRDCITQILETRKQCPQDRKAFDSASLVKPYRLFFQFYESLKIQCDVNQIGCGEVVQLCRFEHHKAECSLNMSSCDKGCGFEGSAKEVKEHVCVRYLKGKLVKLEQDKLESETSLKEEIAELRKTNNFLKKENSLLQSQNNYLIKKTDLAAKSESERTEIIKEIERIDIANARKAIQDLLKRINYKEGMTKLLPQFDPDAESENPFKILGNENFEEEKVEAYLALTFKAIEEHDTYKDVADEIKSNKIFNGTNYNLIIKRDYLGKIWCYPEKDLYFKIGKVFVNIYYGKSNFYEEESLCLIKTKKAIHEFKTRINYKENVTRFLPFFDDNHYRDSNDVHFFHDFVVNFTNQEIERIMDSYFNIVANSESLKDIVTSMDSFVGKMYSKMHCFSMIYSVHSAFGHDYDRNRTKFEKMFAIWCNDLSFFVFCFKK